MPHVIFVMHDGTESKVEAVAGRSVMETARQAGISGIEGECGGNLSCATCHVYVDEEWLDRINPVDAMEDEMLEVVSSGRQANSRLSCQITVNDALDNIRIRIPESQY
jgi:ferredoxin, 2Fe-2S